MRQPIPQFHTAADACCFLLNYFPLVPTFLFCRPFSMTLGDIEATMAVWAPLSSDTVIRRQTTCGIDPIHMVVAFRTQSVCCFGDGWVVLFACCMSSFVHYRSFLYRLGYGGDDDDMDTAVCQSQ